MNQRHIAKKIEFRAKALRNLNKRGQVGLISAEDYVWLSDQYLELYRKYSAITNVFKKGRLTKKSK